MRKRDGCKRSSQGLRKAGGEDRPALSRAGLHTRYPKLYPSLCPQQLRKITGQMVKCLEHSTKDCFYRAGPRVLHAPPNQENPEPALPKILMPTIPLFSLKVCNFE
jgi:hypothetical protein